MAVWDLEVSLLQEDGFVQEKGKIHKTVKYIEIELFAFEKPFYSSCIVRFTHP